MVERNQGERIASLEALRAIDSGRLQSIEEKLDELLELKNKGMGAFWLISVLSGTVVTAVIAFIQGWFA